MDSSVANPARRDGMECTRGKVRVRVVWLCIGVVPRDRCLWRHRRRRGTDAAAHGGAAGRGHPRQHGAGRAERRRSARRFAPPERRATQRSRCRSLARRSCRRSSTGDRPAELGCHTAPVRHARGSPSVLPGLPRSTSTPPSGAAIGWSPPATGTTPPTTPSISARARVKRCASTS